MAKNHTIKGKCRQIRRWYSFLIGAGGLGNLGGGGTKECE